MNAILKTSPPRPGAEAVAAKGWLAAHKWLILRRCSQLGILLLFLVGPWFSLWIVKGNLNFSYTLSFLPLADPYVILQSLAARQVPEKLALIGAAIVLLFYLLVGGRAYCSWVCPVNLLTDFAYWLRVRLGIKGSKLPQRAACNDCMDCFAVCPEPQVIRPALKAIAGTPPMILEANCTNCGRCIDVCSKDVFAFGTRFNATVAPVTGVPQAAPK